MKTNIGLSKKVWMRFKHRFRQEIFSIYRSVAFVSKTFSALFCLRKKMFVLFFFTREREKKVCNKHLDARLGCVQSVGLTSASTRPRFVFVLWLLTLLTFRLVRLAQDRKIVGDVPFDIAPTDKRKNGSIRLFIRLKHLLYGLENS